MNTPVSRSTFSEAMPQAINYLKGGIATVKEHLPTILKLVIPYIVAWILCSLLFSTAAGNLPGNLTDADFKNPEIAGAVYKAAAIPIVALILLVVPLSVYCMFAVLRFAAQDPLPQPSTQTAGSLWRFEPSLFTFVLLCLVQALICIIFLIPASVISLILGLVLFFLPAKALALLIGLPIDFTVGLCSCFFALSGLGFLKSPQSGISAAIERAKSIMTGNLPLWIMVAVLATAGQAVQKLPAWALSTPTTPAPMAAGLISMFLGLAVSVLLLFTCRAASKG